MYPLAPLLFLLLCQTLFAMPRSLPAPGGIVVLPLERNTTSVTFLNRKASLFKHNDRLYALLPVPLATKPGRYELFVGGKTEKIEIEARHYAQQRLRIENRRKVEPNREDMVRIAKERKRKRSAKSFRSAGFARVDFIWPAEGGISSPFGLRRVLNGKPRAPHRGIDIAAPEGAPVYAAADGVVVDAGDFFFSGNLVFIEHHGGLMTTYAHLKRIAVAPGRSVKKGEVIGYVGKTGRVTGPHLHFGLLVDSVYVDPLLFLPIRHPSNNGTKKLSKITPDRAENGTISPEG